MAEPALTEPALTVDTPTVDASADLAALVMVSSQPEILMTSVSPDRQWQTSSGMTVFRYALTDRTQTIPVDSGNPG